MIWAREIRNSKPRDPKEGRNPNQSEAHGPKNIKHPTSNTQHPVNLDWAPTEFSMLRAGFGAEQGQKKNRKIF
jgi:hypothetical protein